MKDFGRGIGFSTSSELSDAEHSRGVIKKALSKAFAPEFINRVDDLVMFDQLSKDSIYKIIDLELEGFYKRVKELGFTIEISDDAKEFIASKGYDVQFGARPLKRAIQKYLEDEMAEMIILTSVSEGDNIKVEFDKENQKIVMNVTKALEAKVK